MDLNIIFFIGPQGSGKGTQAKILATKLGFFHWDMGSILRETGAEDSELGHTVKDLVERGVLLDDELLLKVASAKLSTIPKEIGVILDGIPRRLGQGEYVLNFLKKQGRTNFTTIFLNVPKEETFKRLLLRAEQQHRADDTEKAIAFRLDQYYKDTTPVLDFLKSRTNFIEIDGTPKVSTVTESINQQLR